MTSNSTIIRLRIAHFFFGMMFFYGIEQLFLNKYIGNGSTRAFTTIIFTTSLLLFDVPAGILADKFGRKRALLGACIAQIVALLIMGMSSSLTMYLVGSFLYGVFISLLNGSAQAYLYDYLGQTQETERYAKLQGSMYGLLLVGVSIANLASGFIAHRFGLRVPYLVSVLPSLCAAAVLIKLVEPARQKQAAMKWYHHLHGVAREIKHHPRIIIFGLQFVITMLLFLTIGEFGQIYILSFGIGTVMLGILWSVTAVLAAGARILAHRVQRYPKLTLLGFVLLLGLFILTHSKLGILLFWLIYASNEIVANVAETEIQNETKSEMRATMFSAISFIGNICAVPVIILFNYLYTNRDIYHANYFIGLAAAICLVLSMVAVRSIP